MEVARETGTSACLHNPACVTFIASFHTLTITLYYNAFCIAQDSEHESIPDNWFGFAQSIEVVRGHQLTA
jgi:hypothetical protein